MSEEIKEKKCACKGGNLDRFIQPIILLILAEEAETGYAVFKKMSGFSMFRESRPDATGVYRYLRIMEQRGLLEQFESREAKNKYKMKYCITKAGRECLSNWKVTITAYAEAIGELIGRMEEKKIGIDH